jgi:hypothetical protein
VKFEPLTDELLKLNDLVDETTSKFFGDLDRAEIIADLLSDGDRIYIDSFEKLSCAIAFHHAGLATIAAVGGRFGDMIQHVSHANKHLGICFERSEIQKEISEKARENAKKPRPDPLSSLIFKILTDDPSLTWCEVLEALREHENGEVIEEITEDEIYYIKDGKGGKPAPISGLKDRVSRIKK